MGEPVVESKLAISWQGVRHLVSQIGTYLKNTGQEVDGVVGIGHGGLIPAALLCRELGVRNFLPYFVSSYSDDKKQGQIRAYQPLEDLRMLDRRSIVLIDDIVDTGNTMRVVGSYLPSAYKVALVAKPAGKPAVHMIGQEVDQGTWITFPWE